MSDAPSDDDLRGGHPLMELVHVLSKLHVHSNLSANRIVLEIWHYWCFYKDKRTFF